MSITALTVPKALVASSIEPTGKHFPPCARRQLGRQLDLSPNSVDPKSLDRVLPAYWYAHSTMMSFLALCTILCIRSSFSRLSSHCLPHLNNRLVVIALKNITIDMVSLLWRLNLPLLYRLHQDLESIHQ